MKKQLLCILSILLIFNGLDFNAFAQKKTQKPAENSIPKATSAADRMKGFEKRKELIKNSLVGNLAFRNVGPTVMSGRVVDIDINPTDPSVFFVAFASGGLWKTENNGSTFTPLFEKEAVMTLGDIAVEWKKDGSVGNIWVGSGENNSSRSSYAGAGIYKSADGGKTWAHLGLEETQHIGRIALHPTDPNTAWVSALGHLYSANPERGVFKTTDGGKTWAKTLFINDNTGAIDLVIDPSNPQNLYAATWERSRQAWNFIGNGKGSGIYKSTDGGNTWARTTIEGSGFPATSGVGRIGLDIYAKNPNIIYAVLDNQDPQEKKAEDNTQANALKIKPSLLKTMTTDEFLKQADENITAYMERYGIPTDYSPKSIKEDIKNGKYTPKALADYVNANDDLFEITIKGLEIYRSEDAGKTWKRTHEKYIEDVVYTYGYYFSQVRVNPNDDKELFTMGVPVIRSNDGGKTWKALDATNAHSDHHALWINPNRKGHLILGNDGGINISYDNGDSWLKMNNVAVGQFYSVNVDMATPYNVYGGLQDNGVWGGSSQNKPTKDWHDSGRYPFQMLMGGDGMQIEIDTRDNATIYTGFQFGNYFRANKNTQDRKFITPKHKLGETPYRWNWETPILISKHNQDILYMGSHRFHRSMNKGESFETLSEDLTKGGKEGNVPFGSLTVIHESPKKFGLLYTGSDDGYIHASKDGGYTWKRISDNLPQNLWITQVYASHHAESRVYASMSGYRNDHFEPYVYVSENYGETWQKIGANLPLEPVNVVKEDPENQNIIYVGTDNGAYVSVDRGQTFHAFIKDFPAVSVHDLIVHPRDKELVLGTHGRSFYIANVAPLQKLTNEVLAKNLTVFPFKPMTYNERWGASRGSFSEPFEPSIEIAFYANQSAGSTVKILTASGLVLKEMKDESEKGLNFLAYDLTFDEKALEGYQKELSDKAKKEMKVKKAQNGKYYLQAGEYTIEVKTGETSEKQILKIEAPRERAGRR
jgi:photosystem II stability/assembly factor-like uncharacterized protein